MKITSRIRRKSKHVTTMEWINAETSKAYDDMSVQLVKVESFIFDPIEEAANTMADAADEQYQSMSVSSQKPSPRRLRRRRRKSRDRPSGFLRPTPRKSRSLIR